MKRIIEGCYYHPAFYGSYSIKSVLPALVPEMTYGNLNIQNGDDAISEFVRMAKRDDLSEEEVDRVRRNLLQYCCQDTLAMLKVHQKLDDLSRI